MISRNIIIEGQGGDSIHQVYQTCTGNERTQLSQYDLTSTIYLCSIYPSFIKSLSPSQTIKIIQHNAYTTKGFPKEEIQATRLAYCCLIWHRYVDDAKKETMTRKEMVYKGCHD